MRGGGVPRRVFGYCRVSSDRQSREGTSLEGQRDEIARWCRSQGFPAPTLAIEVESGSAEKAEAREEQKRLTREAEPGDLIVVIAVDRWSRDIVHGVQSVRDIVKRGVRWHSIREGIDAATPQGDSTLGIMAWTADQERRRIRERTVGRRQELADAGHYVGGSIPLGFTRVPGRKLATVESEAALIRDIFARCADGESLPEIAATLPPVRKRTSWTKDAVFHVLHSRYMLGEQRRGDGTWLPDAHPPIVPIDLWERAHAALRMRVAGGRKYAQGDSAHRLLRGLVWCSACERRVSVRFGARHQRQQPDGKRMHYYICRGGLEHACGEGWIRAYEADEAAERAVATRLAELREELARAPAKTAAPKSIDVTAALAKIEARKRRTIDNAADGVISRADLQEALARYEADATKLRRQISREADDRAAEERATDPGRRAAALGQVQALAASWRRMPVEQRREVLALLAIRVEIGRSGVRFTWRSAADLAAKG